MNMFFRILDAWRVQSDHFSSLSCSSPTTSWTSQSSPFQQWHQWWKALISNEPSKLPLAFKDFLVIFKSGQPSWSSSQGSHRSSESMYRRHCLEQCTWKDPCAAYADSSQANDGRTSSCGKESRLWAYIIWEQTKCKNDARINMHTIKIHE